MEYNTIFKKVANYKELHVYQKSDVLVLLTDVFCKRFLPARGDRTVDQMNMAARSGKRDKSHPRYNRMVSYCRNHNIYSDYKILGETLSAEEFCNMAITLCHITDRMFFNYLKYLEKLFVTQGGIKERMLAARTGYRQGVDERLKQLEAENATLKAENEQLKKMIASMTSRTS